MPPHKKSDTLNIDININLHQNVLASDSRLSIRWLTASHTGDCYPTRHKWFINMEKDPANNVSEAIEDTPRQLLSKDSSPRAPIVHLSTTTTTV